MTPEPLPYPDPSEASKTSSLLPTSLSSPPKKDDNKPDASLMNTERPNLSWNLSLVPAKKNGGVEPAEELEMREGTGLMMEGASPCLEFGGGTGIGAAQPAWMDSEAECQGCSLRLTGTRGLVGEGGVKGGLDAFGG